MLQEMKTFMIVVKLKNIIKVAEHLNLPKSTIYDHIKYLEQYFQSNLAIITEKSDVVISNSGNLLYDRAKQIFNIIDSTSMELINLNSLVEGRLKIGVNSILEEYVLPRFLSYFLNKYPNIFVNISSDNNDVIYSKLQENKLDIGLIEESDAYPNFTQKRFLKDRMVLIIPYANTIKDISEYMNEFKSKRWLTREANCETKKFIDFFLKENNISPENIMVLGSNYAIKEAVKNNLGISIVSKFVAEPYYRNDEICILPLDNSYEMYFSYVINENNKSKCVEIFLSELNDFCKSFYR